METRSTYKGWIVLREYISQILANKEIDIYEVKEILKIAMKEAE